MTDFRPIFLVTGVLITIMSAFMLLPMLIELSAGRENWPAFLLASFCSGFFGIMLYLTNRSDTQYTLTLKQTFIMTTVSWVSLALVASLPFLFSNMRMDFTDSFFEAMSGLTTTGATVVQDLDHVSPGILIWRSLLQWMGGIGIIVMAMAVLPLLKIGGMQLFRSESSDNADKALPRARQLAVAITGVYSFMTMACFFLLIHAGMTPFDALNHAMTTVATAGFSTHDASIGHYDSLHIELVIIAFLLISSLHYVLYIQFIRGRTLHLLRDSQVRWFFGFIIFSIAAVTAWLMHDYNISLFYALRMASFNVISVITTTGYATFDYYVWGSFVVVFMFLLAVVGGCTGSTSGGIKIFRIQVLIQTAKAQINQLTHPHGIFKPSYNHKPISDTAAASVMAFIILFGLCFSILAVLLSLTGLDYITSMSAAGSMMANLGPALGPIIGPSGDYAALPDTAKWLCTAGMIIGRLEIFTVLILFSPYFWKN